MTGKVALVTGGSRGLGLQIAEALGEARTLCVPKTSSGVLKVNPVCAENLVRVDLVMESRNVTRS